MKTRYVYYIPVLDKILDFLQVGYLMKTKTGKRERKRERGRERASHSHTDIYVLIRTYLSLKALMYVENTSSLFIRDSGTICIQRQKEGGSEWIGAGLSQTSIMSLGVPESLHSSSLTTYM